MKVGIDYRPALLNRSGIGRYTRELVRAMAAAEGEHELLLFGHSWKKPVVKREELGLEGGKARLVRKRIPSRLIRLLHRIGRRGVEDFLGEVDLFHYTDFVHPPLRGTPFVSTVHDAAFLEPGFFPENSAEALKARSAWAVAESRLLLAPSAFTAGELVLRLGADPRKVVVAPLGSDHLPTPPEAARPDSDRPYFLTVGTIEPRKNHLRLLAVFETLQRKGFSHRWVVAGGKGWLSEPFFERLARSPARDRVEIVWDPDDRRLAALYAGADFLAYPSLYEGFGLPPLEAMHFGVPVLTSSISSLPEVCGEAAVYADPRSESSILEAAERLIEDRALREKLREEGPRQAARFRWGETAAKTLAAYRAALQGVRGSLRRFF